MARKKLSEYRTKAILSSALGLAYGGASIDTSLSPKVTLIKLSKQLRYVVKVDEGVKGRFKKGLVLLGRTATQVPAAVTELAGKGFRHLLVEPQRAHSADDERYLAFERRRDGILVMFSRKGGVHVEDYQGGIQHEMLRPETASHIEGTLSLPEGTVMALGRAFDDNHFSFLELNPLIVSDGRLCLLDAAAEADEAAATLVGESWSPDDFRSFPGRMRTPEESEVKVLAGQSQASFSLEVLNPDGSVFLLLSGGGASIVLADEVNNQGYGRSLGNYGEYSGNPSEEETYRYTKSVVSLMLKSKSTAKVLIIGGGVANFTDVRTTFEGVIRALTEAAAGLRRQHIKVFVRRGGPHEAEGLAIMRRFLEREQILGAVSGPEIALSEIVSPALATIEKEPQI